MCKYSLYVCPLTNMPHSIRVSSFVEPPPPTSSSSLRRLAVQHPPPNREEWEHFQASLTPPQFPTCRTPFCLHITGISFSGEHFQTAEAALSIDLETQAGSNPYSLLAAFLPEAAKDWKERTPREQDVIARWSRLSKWYAALRRVGMQPNFLPPDGKRQRVG